MITAITIDDPVDRADAGAIEVTVTLAGHDTPRWCFFMTPEALRTCGDTLGTHSDVRVHLGVPHMIVVSRIDTEIIHQLLRELDARGELLAHTLAFGEP